MRGSGVPGGGVLGETLPDLLAPNLDVVFVGINPSTYSVQQGHYFARKQNRFWPAFSASRLSAAARQALGVDRLEPRHDVEMQRFGIGFTDVVKCHSPNVTTITPAMFEEGAASLRDRLEAHRPRVACFHGLVGFRPFARYALGVDPRGIELGEQQERLGTTRLYVIPNPSPANAHYRIEDLVGWYDRLAEYMHLLLASDSCCQARSPDQVAP